MKNMLYTLVAMICAATPAAASEVVEVRIDEWEVPYAESRPRDPDVAPDGAVWFVGQRSDYVARLDPDTGAFTRFPLPDGAGPHNLIVADDGAIWYAGNRAAHIGRFDPAGGSIEQVMMPDPAARDPHTLIFDDAGDIWFTLQGSNMVGFLDTESRRVRLARIETERARPYGIVLDDEGTPWLNLLGTNKLARVDPDTMAVTEIELPRASARTRRIAATDAGIWYVDWADGYLGRYDPGDGSVAEWLLPSGADAQPYAMAADADGRIWLFETGRSPNLLWGFDPDSERFFARGEVPSGGGAVRHMVYHQPSGTLWFGTDTNTIGRARLP